jgi:hypothetical protein
MDCLSEKQGIMCISKQKSKEGMVSNNINPEKKLPDLINDMSKFTSIIPRLLSKISPEKLAKSIRNAISSTQDVTESYSNNNILSDNVSDTLHKAISDYSTSNKLLMNDISDYINNVASHNKSGTVDTKGNIVFEENKFCIKNNMLEVDHDMCDLSESIIKQKQIVKKKLDILNKSLNNSKHATISLNKDNNSLLDTINNYLTEQNQDVQLIDSINNKVENELYAGSIDAQNEFTLIYMRSSKMQYYLLLILIISIIIISYKIYN